jgi:hypothetical protein
MKDAAHQELDRRSKGLGKAGRTGSAAQPKNLRGIFIFFTLERKNTIAVTLRGVKRLVSFRRRKKK